MTEAPIAPTPSPIPAPTPKPAPVVAPSPAPAAPAPAAEPAKPSETKGMKDFISNMGKKPVPVSDASKLPEEAPAPIVEAGKPTEVQDAPVIGDDVWEKAPKNLKNAYYKFKRESEGKISDFDKKIKELEGKSNQSPFDIKKIQELEARSSQLEKDLSERENRLMQADYSKSEEFKEKFIKRGEKAYQQAIGDVKRLSVKIVDEAGNESSRQASQSDFDDIRSLPPYEQDKKIHEMFGTSAYRVQSHLRALESLESEANDAITNARTKAEEARRVEEKKRGEFNTEFEGHFQRETDSLSKHETGFFAPVADNPEATAALEKGYKWVDETLANVGKMPPKEAAEAKATLRALAAFAPRGMIEINQLKTENTSLKDELAKYRKSSPGSTPAPTGASKSPIAEPRGINAIVDMMKNGNK